MDSERQVVVTVKWAHPETPALLERLRGLACGSLTAVMESTGVYGDTLRRQLREAGIEVHQMSAKRVHDACEVYDGVPSLHDAKAAQVIGRLYFEGASRVWTEASEQARSHDAMGRLYRLYQKQHQQQQNRLEAALTRHCRFLAFRRTAAGRSARAADRPAGIGPADATLPIGMEMALSMARLGAEVNTCGGTPTKRASALSLLCVSESDVYKRCSASWCCSA
ncbi:MAG: hypothetical protein ACREXW_09735 [Gammaproteobacteria bacterium]